MGRSKPQVIVAPAEVIEGLAFHGYKLRKPLTLEVDLVEDHTTLYVPELDVWTYAPSLPEALKRLPAVIAEVFAVAREDGDQEQVERFRRYLEPTKRTVGVRPAGRKLGARQKADDAA